MASTTPSSSSSPRVWSSTSPVVRAAAPGGNPGTVEDPSSALAWKNAAGTPRDLPIPIWMQQMQQMVWIQQMQQMQQMMMPWQQQVRSSLLQTVIEAN